MLDLLRNPHHDVGVAAHRFLARLAFILAAGIEDSGARQIVGRKTGDGSRGAGVGARLRGFFAAVRAWPVCQQDKRCRNHQDRNDTRNSKLHDDLPN